MSVMFASLSCDFKTYSAVFEILWGGSSKYKSHENARKHRKHVEEEKIERIEFFEKHKRDR